MKVLLTGLPKSGKSTMLASLITDVHSKHGMSSPEVRENGERIGFDLLDAGDNAAILSRVGTPTDYPVGRYYVDLVSLEQFIEPLFKYTSEQLLFIDEIGQMQLYSERFKSLVRDYLIAPNDFIGTISQVYEHSFIHDLRESKDILFCAVTPDNREPLKTALAEALKNSVAFNTLSSERQLKALGLARDYLASDKYISLMKLFKNAVPYISDNRISREADRFIVKGNTNNHYVRIIRNGFVCDCDFFNGRGQFMGNAGECSHIQSAKLLSI